MLFAEVSGDKRMKLLQDMVFMTDILLNNGLSGKEIGNVQKEDVTMSLYPPEKKLMLNLQ